MYIFIINQLGLVIFPIQSLITYSQIVKHHKKSLDYLLLI